MKKLFLIALFLIITTPAKAEGYLDIQDISNTAGFETWLVEDHTTPVISISFAFKGGMALEPSEKAGLARMVSILLDEGAGDLTSSQFQKELNDHSIELRFTGGRDAFYGELRMLTKYKDKALKLLNLALTEPRFDEEAVTRMKNANLARIKHDMGRPNWLASRSFNGTVFEGHPYSQPGYGTLESIPQITIDDLVSFVETRFARDTLKVAVVGDVTAEELPGMLETAFKGLPDTSEKFEVLDAQWQHAGKTLLLPLDIPQTVIAAGHTGIPRKHPDWHTAQIVNYILGGGGFGSRLMEELREKRGLTYGIYTQLNHLQHASSLQFSVSTKNESAAEVLKLIDKEWKDIAAKGITEEELNNAKSYFIGALALQLTSTGRIAGLLTSIQQDELGIDYLDRRKGLIESITLDDTKRVAKELLDADNLTTILVGAPENVTADSTLERAPGT